MVSEGVDEPEVFDQTGHRLVVAVTVRDLVAQHCRKTGLVDDLGDRIEAAADGRGRGVMIKERGAAPTDAIGGAEQGGQPNRLRCQRAVEQPPEALEDLPEVFRRFGRRETAGKGRVEVVVEVDEPGHHQPAACIEKLRFRVLPPKLGFRPYRDDLRTGPCNGTLGPHLGSFTARHDGAVVEDIDVGSELGHATPRRTHSPVPAGAKNSVPSGRRSKTDWPRT